MTAKEQWQIEKRIKDLKRWGIKKEKAKTDFITHSKILKKENTEYYYEYLKKLNELCE